MVCLFAASGGGAEKWDSKRGSEKGRKVNYQLAPTLLTLITNSSNPNYQLF